MTIEITISDLKPLPKARPRFSRGGNVYHPKRSRAYERALAGYYRVACPEPWTCPVRVAICFATRSRADVDNLAKSCLDAGNGILYTDDRQVVQLEVRKVSSDSEEIHITMEKISGD